MAIAFRARSPAPAVDDGMGSGAESARAGTIDRELARART